jgi:hypothetical protein
MTARIQPPGQVRKERTARAGKKRRGQPVDRQNRTGRTGRTEQDG